MGHTISEEGETVAVRCDDCLRRGRRGGAARFSKTSVGVAAWRARHVKHGGGR
jgi:hypothetical protein